MKSFNVQLTEEEIIFLICTLNPEHETAYNIKLKLMDNTTNEDVIIDLSNEEYSVRESNIYEITQKLK